MLSPTVGFLLGEQRSEDYPEPPARMIEGISGQVIKLSTTTIGSEANLGWRGMVGMAFAKKGGFKFAA